MTLKDRSSVYENRMDALAINDISLSAKVDWDRPVIQLPIDYINTTSNQTLLSDERQ